MLKILRLRSSRAVRQFARRSKASAATQRSRLDRVSSNVHRMAGRFPADEDYFSSPLLECQSHTQGAVDAADDLTLPFQNRRMCDCLMGDDGARGMAEMHTAGAFTVAQYEASSVVFGMPKEAIAHGGVDRVVPLDQIAREILAADRRR